MDLFDPATYEPLFGWLSRHPAWAGLFVFAIALGESLVVVGLAVPGTVLMFGVGALVGAGVLGLWETMAWAFAGAVAGDGVSFWLGRRYRGQIRQWWPFRRHPELFQRGEGFFHRHGGKSILFGRFVGPVRPIIPAVAGMLGMPPLMFMAINVLSAMGWAPAYLLPGIVFGTSLGLAKEVATRLAVLLLLVAAALILVWWLARRMTSFIQPRANAILARVWAWGVRHPRSGRVATALLDPDHPETRALFVLAGILVAAVWLFVGVLVSLAGDSPLVRADEAVLNLFQSLRTPWADWVMAFFSTLGGPLVMAVLAGLVGLWLAQQRNWSALYHWAAALAFGIAATLVLKWTVDLPPPPALPQGAASFPDWHAVMATTGFGFVAVLVAGRMSLSLRWLPYGTAAILVSAICLAQLYLGAAWVSDVVGGAALGLIWATLLGVAYRRHLPTPPAPGPLAAVALGGALITATWTTAFMGDDLLQRYAQTSSPRTVSRTEWLEGLWRQHAPYRTDLRGELKAPMNVQWAGNLDVLRRQLAQSDWQAPVPLSLATALRWLTPQPRLANLPVLPHVHNGRHESLLMVNRQGPQDQWVIRLWPAETRLAETGQPVWIGNVSRQQLSQPLNFLALQRTATDFNGPMAALESQVPALVRARVNFQAPEADLDKEIQWNGDVLLMAPPAGDDGE